MHFYLWPEISSICHCSIFQCALKYSSCKCLWFNHFIQGMFTEHGGVFFSRNALPYHSAGRPTGIQTDEILVESVLQLHIELSVWRQNLRWDIWDFSADWRHLSEVLIWIQRHWKKKRFVLTSYAAVFVWHGVPRTNQIILNTQAICESMWLLFTHPGLFKDLWMYMNPMFIWGPAQSLWEIIDRGLWRFAKGLPELQFMFNWVMKMKMSLSEAGIEIELTTHNLGAKRARREGLVFSPPNIHRCVWVVT